MAAAKFLNKCMIVFNLKQIFLKIIGLGFQIVRGFCSSFELGTLNTPLILKGNGQS